MIFYGTLSMILFFGAENILADAIQKKSRPLYFILCALDVAAVYTVLQFLQRDGSNGHISGIYILPLAVLFTAEFILFALMLRHKRTHVTPMSVKEAVDMLPDGMCYYYDDGRVKLVNRTMNDIAKDVLGANVTDGVKLWQHISDKEAVGARFLQTGGETLVRTGQGNVYSIKRQRICISGEWINELVASDITDEFELQVRLNKKNEKLRLQRKRLLEMNERITDLTIEKEILQARINIHDDLGKSLIAIKQYLSGGIDKDSLMNTVRTSMVMLDSQKTAPEYDDYRTVLKAAEDVGISVEIDGQLPQDDDRKQIITTALRECITNTFRHAEGDTLYVKIDEGDTGELTAVFTNNGKDPEGPIKETGGLRSLRDLSESKGAVMTVHDSPHFMLEISMLPIR